MKIVKFCKKKCVSIVRSNVFRKTMGDRGLVDNSLFLSSLLPISAVVSSLIFNRFGHNSYLAKVVSGLGFVGLFFQPTIFSMAKCGIIGVDCFASLKDFVCVGLLIAISCCWVATSVMAGGYVGFFLSLPAVFYLLNLIFTRVFYGVGQMINVAPSVDDNFCDKQDLVSVFSPLGHFASLAIVMWFIFGSDKFKSSQMCSLVKHLCCRYIELIRDLKSTDLC